MMQCKYVSMKVAFFSLIMGVVGCQSIGQAKNPRDMTVTASQKKAVQTYLGRTPTFGINRYLDVLSYTFGDESSSNTLFTLTPMRVLEDSRCPINARCIKQGHVVLEAKVTSADQSSLIKLTTADSVEWQGYRFTLSMVLPQRTTQVRLLDEMDYVFQLDIDTVAP